MEVELVQTLFFEIQSLILKTKLGKVNLKSDEVVWYCFSCFYAFVFRSFIFARNSNFTLVK